MGGQGGFRKDFIESKGGGCASRVSQLKSGLRQGIPLSAMMKSFAK
jgi:hypothetical protein